MSKVLLVDWLGRGGIAQTSEAWSAALRGRGHQVVVASRPDRELDELGEFRKDLPQRPNGRVRAHRRLVRAAAAFVGDWRPDLVVVQNFVLAPFEVHLTRAAVRAGARLVHVVHDHRLHSPLAGTRAGLRSSLRAADDIWVHSHFVGDALERYAGRRCRVVPLPLWPKLLSAGPPYRPAHQGNGFGAVHFGVLKRGYKGTDQVLALARQGVQGWRFHLLGVGAPPGDEHVVTSPGFVSDAALAGAVAESDATILPYRVASQSGAVVLAQALGSIPVASAVGGIPEQIADGVDGVLLAARSTPEAWRDALMALSADADLRAAMALAGARRVRQGHESFLSEVGQLMGERVAT